MSKKVFPVQFHFLTPCALADRRMLKGFIVSIFKKEKRSLESILFVFCDDKTLLNLNMQFLKHDYYTSQASYWGNLYQRAKSKGKCREPGFQLQGRTPSRHFSWYPSFLRF